jgi:tetratricopeptide (TPR) repeat protein
MLLGPGVRPSMAQVVVAGTIGTPETDLTPEQEQHLLAEYWTIARRYVAEPARATKEMLVWTRDRIGKVQSIQYQPESAARPDYLEGKAEWNPAMLRAAAMLHSDLALEAFGRRNIPEFEFQIGIADGWLALADDRKSEPGSLRSRWNVTVARLLLASGKTGVAEEHLGRVSPRIPGDAAILLAYGTIRETQASRLVADAGGSKLQEPSMAVKPRDAALDVAAAQFEKALAVDPTMVEAKLRLAHVHILKRDDPGAEPLLTGILAGQPAPAMKYLASLMLGGIRERRGQFEAAGRTYVEAIQAVPDGQCGYIALAQLMNRLNQPSDAATVIERMFARGSANSAADPWWTYPMGLDLTMDAKFEEYRAAVRK